MRAATADENRGRLPKGRRPFSFPSDAERFVHICHRVGPWRLRDDATAKAGRARGSCRGHNRYGKSLIASMPEQTKITIAATAITAAMMQPTDSARIGNLVTSGVALVPEP